MVVGLSKKAAKPVTRVQECVSSFVSVKTTLSLYFVGTKNRCYKPKSSRSSPRPNWVSLCHNLTRAEVQHCHNIQENM